MRGVDAALRMFKPFCEPLDDVGSTWDRSENGFGSRVDQLIEKFAGHLLLCTAGKASELSFGGTPHIRKDLVA